MTTTYGLLKEAILVLVLAAACAACNSSTDDRVNVPTSKPQVACSRVEGRGSSKNAESAIAHAKDTWAAIYEKNPSGEVYSPANTAKFEPYTATLKDGVWHIEGTVPPGYHGYMPITSICENDSGATVEWVQVP